MNPFLKLSNRIKALLFHSKAEGELSEEMKFHIEMQTQKNIDSGMSKTEAFRQAKLSFGGVEQTMEECRDSWGIRMINDFVRDLIYGLRKFRKQKMGWLLWLMLGLCMGGVLLTLWLLELVFWKSLPVEDEDRIAMVWSSYKRTGDLKRGVSISHFVERRDHANSFDKVALTTGHGNINFGDSERTDLIPYFRVTPSYFELFETEAYVGRIFEEEDALLRSEQVVLLSYDYWKSSFNADRNVIGKIKYIDDQATKIIGVLPPDVFIKADSLAKSEQPKIIIAFTFPPPGNRGGYNGRHNNWNEMYVRLKSGVTLEQAENEIRHLNQTHGEAWAQRDERMGFEPYLTTLRSELTGPLVPYAITLGIATLILLGIVTFNVASFLLGNAQLRQNEIASRAALGASPSRLFTQNFNEILILLLPSVLAGVGFYFLFHNAIRLSGGFSDFPVGNDPHISVWGILLVALVGTLMTWIFSLLIAKAYGEFNLQKMMSRGLSVQMRAVTQRSRSNSVIFITAFSIILFISSVLFLKSFVELSKVKPGFETDNIITTQINLPRPRYNDGPDIRFFENLLREVKRLPGVEDATLMNNVPYTGLNTRINLQLSGYTPQEQETLPYAIQIVGDENLLDVLGIRVLDGRGIQVTDTADNQPVALIDHYTASHFFPDRSPIGSTIRGISRNGPVEFTIVGVVEDTKFTEGTDLVKHPTFYAHFKQANWGWYYLVIKTPNDSETFIRPLQQALASIDPNVGLQSVTTFDAIIESTLLRRKLFVVLIWVYTGTSILFSLLGIYGIIAQTMGAKTREIGLRIALGALPQGIVKFYMSTNLRTVLIGVAAGTVVCFLLTQYLAKKLSDLFLLISPTDPLVYLGSTTSILVIVSLAILIPVVRASRMKPTLALHEE